MQISQERENNIYLCSKYDYDYRGFTEPISNLSRRSTRRDCRITLIRFQQALFPADRNPKLIGVYGTSKEENEAFLYMAAHFRKKGLPVPEVYICSEDKNCYLQEDLGDILLFNAIEKGGRPASSPKRRKNCCARPSAYCLPSNLPEQTALIFTLLSPSRIQPTFYPLGLELF